MYKHAWGLRLTSPRLVIRMTPLERQQKKVDLYLEQVAVAELTNIPIPKMPLYLWEKYKNTVRAVGGVQQWATKRPEYKKNKSAAARTLNRIVSLYLKQVAIAELKNRPIPKMPLYLWEKYKNKVRAVGGVQQWATKRPEYKKNKSAAARTLNRIKPGRRKSSTTKSSGA